MTCFIDKNSSLVVESTRPLSRDDLPGGCPESDPKIRVYYARGADTLSFTYFYAEEDSQKEKNPPLSLRVGNFYSKVPSLNSILPEPFRSESKWWRPLDAPHPLTRHYRRMTLQPPCETNLETWSGTVCQAAKVASLVLPGKNPVLSKIGSAAPPVTGIVALVKGGVMLFRYSFKTYKPDNPALI